MAEQSSTEDRTEQPTEKKLNDAKLKGQVPKSKELANIAVMGSAAVALMASASWAGQVAIEWGRGAFSIDPGLLQDPPRMFWHFFKLLGGLAVAALPVISVALLACFISPALMGGLRFTSSLLQPKWERISPLAGLKRIYGKEGLMELVKSILRVVIVGAIGFFALRHMFPSFISTLHMPVQAASQVGMGNIFLLVLLVVLGMGALAILDVPWQHFSHLRQLRMTKQEVKDEMKQTEGSPEVKGKLRQLQRQFATGRMMEAVPKADVVVVNPTHYAVALKWDDKRMGAPVVVAKGYDAVALRIKEIARDSRVPIVESPPLARVLTATSEIGDEIPPHLYEAVAAVIAYITQLRRWHPARGAMPTYNPVPVIENKDQK